MAVIHQNRVDRVEETRTIDHGDVEQRTRVVRNIGVERALATARVVNFVWLIAAVLETLLGVRFVLRLIAANPSNAFAAFIYNLSAFFLGPFQGLTPSPSAGGVVVEIPTIIAMFVYAFVFWLITELIRVLMASSTAQTVTTVEHEHSDDEDV